MKRAAAGKARLGSDRLGLICILMRPFGNKLISSTANACITKPPKTEQSPQINRDQQNGALIKYIKSPKRAKL